ncbi:MAG TPA: response regulator [Coleofasciculaceae cyanobacterium]|jgi:DNA-binding NarL/FixJ family response regulator
MIRVLLVDDQKMVRESLKISLKSEADIEIVGTANNGIAAIEQVELLHPDIVIMNMEMPGLDGASATKQITNRFTETKVLIHTSCDSNEYIIKSLAMGAKGYLLKNVETQDLAVAIRNIYRGYTQIAPGLLEKLLIYTDSGVVISKLKSPASSRQQSTTITPITVKPQKAISNLQLACRQQQDEIAKLRRSLDSSQSELPKIKRNLSNQNRYIWLISLVWLISLSILGLYLFELNNKTNNLQRSVIPTERVGLHGEFSLSGIAQRVTKAFEQDSALRDVSTVYVAQEDDAIILTGTISNATLLRRMENIALQVTGVRKVYSSQIAVRPELTENILNSGK